MATTLLGVAFAPEFTQVAFVKAINPAGAAAGQLAAGDVLLSINGVGVESPSVGTPKQIVVRVNGRVGWDVGA